LIDTAYAVHEDMHRKTGGFILMAYGGLNQKLAKQKLNAKSLTETEVISVSDILPHNIWLINCMEAQGYYVKESILYQDNQSTIKI